jgi:hypothetical protein
MIDVITKAGAQFRSLADPWCDTTTPHGKLILTVLAGLAEFERSLIIGRTQAGIARAKARGVTFSRPAKLNPPDGRRRTTSQSPPVGVGSEAAMTGTRIIETAARAFRIALGNHPALPRIVVGCGGQCSVWLRSIFT